MTDRIKFDRASLEAVTTPFVQFEHAPRRPSDRVVKFPVGRIVRIVPKQQDGAA